MIDLSHIYFVGEDQLEQVQPVGRYPKSAFRTARDHRLIGQKNTERARSDAHKELSPLVRFIFRRSGIAEEGYQAKAVNRRVPACLRTLNVGSEQAGITELKRRPELLRAALGAILIGVSEFFRDTAVFEQLLNEVLPRAVRKSGALRVYSAGCSGGQELYSVAMILDQLDCLPRNHLLGVDCRPEAIEQARSGAFLTSDLKHVEERLRRRYFKFEVERAFISPHLRRNTFWQVGDLGVFRNTEPWDLILFRNVAIYLEPEYAHSVWRRLDRQLKPEGVIVIGSAERPPDDLGWTREAACIYRKTLRPIS